MNATIAYIGLGSNQQDPLRQLHQALEALGQCPQTTLAATSAVYRSRPVGPADQPDYLNMVACLHTRLPALELLDKLQTIEKTQGRVRGERWGPRPLDLDLLLYGDEIITHPRLQVPHPEMTRRDFVLQPLLDIQPDVTLPDGQSLMALREHCPDNGLERLANT